MKVLIPVLQLQRKIRKIIIWALPYGLVRGLKCAKYLFFIFRHARNGSWKLPQKSNDECLIIANGPSVNQNLSNILAYRHKIDVFTVNYATSMLQNIPSKVHVLADPRFFGADSHIKEIEKNVDSFYETLNALNTIFSLAVPHQYYHIARERIFNNNIHLLSYPTDRWPSYADKGALLKLKHLLLQKGIVGFGAQTVPIAALYLALMMGYKKIWIVGLDLSFKIYVDCHCRCYFDYEHFYDSQKPQIVSETPLYDQYTSLSNAYSELNEVKKYSTQNSIQIINISLDSMVDVFPKGMFGAEPFEFLSPQR